MTSDEAKRNTRGSLKLTIDDAYKQPPEEKKPAVKKKKLSKAEKKARKLEAAIEFKKLELRDLLRRELELSKRSARRGHAVWENMCKEVKIIEFRQDLKTWNAKSQRILQQKDEKITMLLDDMQSTQEMHRRHFARQLQIMEHITKSYRTMLDSARALYESQSTEIIKDFYEELHETEDGEERIKTNCENIMHLTNIVVEQQLLQDYHIYMEKRDDVVNTEIQQRYQLRDGIVVKMKDLRKQLLDFVCALQDSSLDVHKYERISQLMERQRNFVLETQKLSDVESQTISIHSELQRELLHTELESQRQVNNLRLELAYFMQVHQSIENKMELDRRITFEKLKILCGECFEVVKQLKRMEKSGDLLLCLAANCRKLQTESEKVLPWGDFQGPQHMAKKMQWDNYGDISLEKAANEQYFQLKVLDIKSHLDLSEKELVDQMALMRNFWRRQALVETHNFLLKEEKYKLIAENEKYINFIKSMSKSENEHELLATMTVKSVLVTPPHCQQKSRSLVKTSPAPAPHAQKLQLLVRKIAMES